MKLSVVLPTLDEETAIAATLLAARRAGADEIIVVDGGSSDATPAIAANHADRTLGGPRGRALQMNLGARAAGGDVLLFLHADTILPANAATAIEAALRVPGTVGGRFDVELVPGSALLRLVGTLMNLRSRLSGIATGDQAIFVRRDVFHDLGGFAEIPLMEDIEFSRRLKRAGRLAPLRARVLTSSRRWREGGTLSTIGLMWSLRFLYFLGVSPQTLRRAYVDRR